MVDIQFIVVKSFKLAYIGVQIKCRVRYELVSQTNVTHLLKAKLVYFAEYCV